MFASADSESFPDRFPRVFTDSLSAGEKVPVSYVSFLFLFLREAVVNLGQNPEYASFRIHCLNQPKDIVHACLRSTEQDHLIRLNQAIFRNTKGRKGPYDGIFLQACHEKDPGITVSVKVLVIHVAPVKHIGGIRFPIWVRSLGWDLMTMTFSGRASFTSTNTRRR
jgi:hypothetical protein